MVGRQNREGNISDRACITEGWEPGLNSTAGKQRTTVLKLPTVKDCGFFGLLKISNGPILFPPDTFE